MLLDIYFLLLIIKKSPIKQTTPDILTIRAFFPFLFSRLSCTHFATQPPVRTCMYHFDFFPLWPVYLSRPPHRARKQMSKKKIIHFIEFSKRKEEESIEKSIIFQQKDQRATARNIWDESSPKSLSFQRVKTQGGQIFFPSRPSPPTSNTSTSMLNECMMQRNATPFYSHSHSHLFPPLSILVSNEKTTNNSLSSHGSGHRSSTLPIISCFDTTLDSSFGFCLLALGDILVLLAHIGSMLGLRGVVADWHAHSYLSPQLVRCIDGE